MKSLAIVFVQWRDSETEIGWSAYERQALGEVTSVGILIEKAEDHYVIAHSIDPTTKEFNGIIRIPLENIVKARTLCRVQVKSG